MEQATNLFNKGLLLDTHPMVLSNDTLTDCLNGTLITMNGNEVILQNDMGNRRVDKAFLPPGYEPVGMKEYGGIIYVASYNPITNKSQIGSFPSPLKKLSSNTTGEAPIFDFQSFTNGSNVERDDDLDLNVLKSDSFMLPLTKDLTLRAGDKFAVYSEGLSELSNLLTNYNNVDSRFPNKAYTPKNRKYTLQLGVLNSQNEFVDITKTLCRWKNIGTSNSSNWQPVNYASDVSEVYKFNDGYFISNAFTNTFFEETIEDAKLIKERLKIAANTYSFKLVGPLYLKAIINHIENFNYNIYGIYDGEEATLWIEGYLTYNCPDGASAIINSLENNLNENYATFDEGTPNSNFGFDLIGKSPVNTQIEKSVYNPNNNTYTVKIVKKYEHITGNKGTIFNYVLGVKTDIDNSGVYLKGLSVKGSVDLALLGSGLLKFNGWRFYNDSENKTSLLTFAFNAYPEYGKSFIDLRFIFRELNTNNYYYYPTLSGEAPALPIYNGKQTISFGWDEIGLSPKRTYTVQATYRIQDNKTGAIGLTITIPNYSITRWFLTTELFNEFYNGKDGVSDFCNNASTLFANKMIILLEGKSEIRNQSRESQEMEGSLITNKQLSISYLCKHTYTVNVLTNPTLSIKNDNLYPNYIEIPSDRKNKVEINNISLISIGNLKVNPSNYSNILRNQLITVEGINLGVSNGINPLQNLEDSTLLEQSLNITQERNSGRRINIGGEIKYYDIFKAVGETINNITNGFDRFSKILDSSHVLPSSGYYGGVILDFGDFAPGLDGHYLNVVVNLNKDTGDLTAEGELRTGWYRVHEVDSDITEDGNYNDANWNISDYLGSIFLIFNDSVKDSDKTFLYYFCEGNKYIPSANAGYGYNGKNGAAFTRAWWKMPNGEWACFRSLFKKLLSGSSVDLSESFKSFIISLLGNKELVYCMYDEYSENTFMYAPKENYIYYDRYDIPITYTISYKLQSGYSVNNIVTNCNPNNAYKCGNLLFSVSNDLDFSSDTVEFNLKSSEKFYDNINKVDSENISNIFIGWGSAQGLLHDSLGRPLNPSYVYCLNGEKLDRIDRNDFYIDSANKTREGGMNRLLYNINRKSSVEDRCQVTDGNDEDSYTRLTYNSLNVVVPV